MILQVFFLNVTSSMFMVLNLFLDPVISVEVALDISVC